MDWNIIIPISIFISDIILAWFCYWLGCHKVKPIEINNEELLKQKKELENWIDELKNLHKNLTIEDADLAKKISLAKEELSSAEKMKNIIEASNKQTQNFIAQSEQLAKEKAEAIYNKKYSELEHEYEIYKKNLQTTIDWNENKIQEQKNELRSLQETRAAAIAAAQKEKEIKENKDDYCLILPIEEANDITILRGVIRKITKPRAILMAIWQAYYQPIAKKKFPQILGKADVCGIYKITNQQTGECYIGQARDCKKRWYEHCRCGIGIDTPQGSQLYSAMLEYGLDAFSFELLLECDPSQLNEKEKYFIELYNSNIVGYNINKGAN